MLKSAQKHLAEMEAQGQDYGTKALRDVEDFISGQRHGVSRLAAFSNACHLRTHRAVVSVAHTDQIDWQSWRMAVDLQELNFRCVFRKGAPGVAEPYASTVSGYLWLAIANTLIGAEEAAVRQMQPLLHPIVKVVETMVAGNKTKPLLGAVGFAFQQILGKVPDHPAFAIPEGLATAAGLAEAVALRKTYADQRRPGGALLPSPLGDLIPLELILLNQSLPDGAQDPVLRGIGERIAATVYPDIPTFIALDTLVSAQGY